MVGSCRSWPSFLNTEKNPSKHTIRGVRSYFNTLGVVCQGTSLWISGAPSVQPSSSDLETIPRGSDSVNLIPQQQRIQQIQLARSHEVPVVKNCVELERIATKQCFVDTDGNSPCRLVGDRPAWGFFCTKRLGTTPTPGLS